jgi:hypothetical protein
MTNRGRAAFVLGAGAAGELSQLVKQPCEDLRIARPKNSSRTSSLRCGRSTLILIFHGKTGTCREDGPAPVGRTGEKPGPCAEATTLQPRPGLQ